MYNSYNYNAPASHSPNEPDEAPILGLLQHLNKDELSDLHENETKVLEMVCDNSQIKAMRTTKETLEASIRSLAEYNMDKKPVMEAKREILKSLHKQVNDAKEAYDFNRGKFDSVANVSPEVILALLQASLAEVEEQSENTASSFLAGDIDCDAFLDQFRLERKLAHQRRVRSEKMAELAVSAPPHTRAPVAAPAPTVTATSVAPTMAMPTPGPPPLPPRSFTVGGPPPYAPPGSGRPDVPPVALPARPQPAPVAASYWGPGPPGAMPMPQPFGAGPGHGPAGPYGAGGYSPFFQQQRM